MSLFVPAGYYQPAGPLITVPGAAHHPGGGQPPLSQPPLTKSVPLSDGSPVSTTPSTSAHDVAPPTNPTPGLGAGSTNGDSSDSEVIITSVTTGCGSAGSISSKDPPPLGVPSSHHPPPPPHSYRYAPSQYPPPPPSYPYSYPATYHYAPPPGAAQYSAAPPHELCYSPGPAYVHKYQYRRYLGTHQYYGTAGDVYAPPPVPPAVVGQQSQQVVTAPASGTSTLSTGSTGSSYVSAPTGGGPPPPLVDTYAAGGPPHQAALVEAYQPAPPQHYYAPAYGPPPPPPCYTHSPAAASRGIPYINATYQSCPCPIQSCPKNGHAGPLTGADGKRSSTNSSKQQQQQQQPLPPVALALPLEPASAHGPPSPARGSAGMPPPPSPAGATYHQPPPAQAQPQAPPTLVGGGATVQVSPKREEPTQPEGNQAPTTGTDQDGKEKKRKARIGKAMVRNNIMQQNTMLLMCNPPQNFVKREIVSPKEKDVIEEKKDNVSPIQEEIKPVTQELPVPCPEPTEQPANNNPDVAIVEPKEEVVEVEKENNNNNIITNLPEKPVVEETILPPVVSTVAENVKVKNMKRKLSVCKEKVPEPELSPPPKKKQKLGSYKMLIKRETNCVKIHNGKRKLISENGVTNRRPKMKTGIAKKRKLSLVKEQLNKRSKLSTLDNLKQVAAKPKKPEGVTTTAAKKLSKKQTTSSTKTVPTSLDTLIAQDSIDRTIESVISEVCHNRTLPDKSSAKKTVSKLKEGKPKEATSKEIKCKKTTKEIATKDKPKEPKEVKDKESLKEVKPSKNVKCKKIASKKKTKSVECVEVPQLINKIPRRSLQGPRWSNGWSWEGDPYEAKVFINSDEVTAVRRCFPAMRHMEGDKIVPRDCVLLKAGPRKNDLPFVAKIAALWENPEDGEMMMSLLWYYRPEHTEQGRLPTDQPDEVFASRHKDSNSVACIDDKCYVLTFNEYCRYRKRYKRLEEGIEETLPCIPNPEPYPRSHRQPPSSDVSPEMVFFCRRVYDFRQKRIIKNPT
ncbi:unnamed protein product [Acanthoscelides obtectus]|uniref:BAH domain-containing protein n=1 Tax=Acanthoscelides obtectus TaxID=200917 RepID=A0A9P0P3M1_ACAOB|nr:unnamed protein product [Acanthoscelides obtectus]CAK1673409.1 Bromo adjacent homology domain-containing 1 protein [Acanthoscelides obtectus]